MGLKFAGQRGRWIQGGFLMALFVFYFLWAYVQPFNVSPDEGMRYDVSLYIYETGALPAGGEFSIRDENWGHSYAFMPILSYMISAVFMKAAAVFSTDPFVLLMAARLVGVIFGVLTAWMAMLISGKIIAPPCRWLFVLLVAFLPQQIFVSSYVNTDAMAIFSTAVIVYMWILALERGWDVKSCMGLAAGVSLCALSYYNAYGFILCSGILFCLSLFWAWNNRSQRLEMLKKAALMILVTSVCAGWWFARNYLLYDGDILGMAAAEECAQMYAREDLKPSNIMTPQRKGQGVLEMVVAGGGDSWLRQVVASFIGCFGALNCPLEYWMYGLYLSVMLLGLVGFLRGTRRFFAPRASGSGAGETAASEETCLGGCAFEGRLRLAEERGDIAVPEETCWNRCAPVGRVRLEGVFHWIMLIALIIPNVLNVYYSYAVDYQPQGRYSLPMLIPLMYFMAEGIGFLMEKVVKNRGARKTAMSLICGAVVLVGITSFTNVFLPLYR